jgi:serine/threonine protein kinase
MEKFSNGGLDNSDQLEQYTNEVNALSCLDHPNIIKLYNYCETKNYYYFFLELAEDDLLSELLRNKFFPENISKKLVR